MKIVYRAIWYDPDKCEKKAIEAGWDPKSGDGFLDIYFPEEDPKGHEAKDFTELTQAVDFLKGLIAHGKDFWGQGRINKIEVDGKRCQYCTCRGWNVVHTYIIEPEGIVEDSAEDNCCSD